MHTEEFIESVHELIARRLTIDVSTKIVKAMTGEIGRDGDIEDIVYEHIMGALQLARKEISRERVGTMTFDEAMELVDNDELVARASWPILWAVFRGGDGKVESWELDNLDGGPTGYGHGELSDDDRNAT